LCEVGPVIKGFCIEGLLSQMGVLGKFKWQAYCLRGCLLDL
jgi:hypothetical protein